MSAPIRIPVQVEETGASVLDSLGGQFDNLAARGDKLTASMTGTERAAQSLQAQLMAMNAAFDALTGGTGDTLAAQDKLAQMFGRVGTAASVAADTMKLYGNTLDLVGGQMGTLGEAMGAQVTAFDAQAAAADRATAAITRQIVAIGDLYAVNLAGGAKATAVGAVGAAEADASLINKRGLANLATGHGNALGALTGAAFSGPGLFAIGGLYAGYKAVGAGAGFQSAEAQTGAQIGNMGTAVSVGQEILNYGASGKDPYNATVQMKSIEPLLAHGYSEQADAAAIAPLSQLSAQNKAPDLTTAINGLNTYLSLQGSGPKSTPAQMKQGVDFISQMEKLTTIPPGQLSTALPRLLAGVIGTGVTADEAGAMLLKVGTANPSARLDSTGIVRMLSDVLVKPTAGAQKTAAALGLAIGPGALDAYGGSTTAMMEAYSKATAGPNQTKLLSQLFTQTNALQAFQELRLGGGSQQTLGYQAKLEKSSGAAQSAYEDYSKGINQQATQLMNQFNADLTTVGLTLNSTVTPALLKLANEGLKDFSDGLQTILNWGKSSPSNPAGGTPGDTLIHLLTPGSPGFLNLTAARDEAARGTKDSGIGPSVGNFFDGVVNWMNHPSIGMGTGTAAAAGMVTVPSNYAGPLLPNMRRAPGIVDSYRAPMPTIVDSYRAPAASATNGALTDLQAKFSGLSGVLPDITLGFTVLGQSATLINRQMAALGMDKSMLTNVPVQQDRSTLNALLTGGGTAAQLNAQLAALKTDLPGSKYTAAQQSGIYSQESFKVRSAIAGPADQLAIQAAQQNLDAAQQMGAMPKELKRYQDEYLAAERKFYEDTQKGSTLAASLRGVAQQGAVYGHQDNTTAMNRTIKDLTNQETLDQLNHNLTGLTQTQNDLLAYQTAHAKALGLDSSDLALLKAQNVASLRSQALLTPGRTLVRGPESGEGDALAGYGSTTARLSQRGGENPLAATVRHLEQTVTLLQQQLVETQRNGQTLTAIKDIDEGQANEQPAHTPAPHYAPPTHNRSRVL